MLELVALLALMLLALMLLALLLRWSFVIAQPDEWIIAVRDGRLRKSGVGIILWRRPGDVVARFSSTVQRVKFSIEVLTQENLPALVDGFILWSVAPDGAFRAFSKLGIANLNAQSKALRSQKHLLTAPQYRAFQALLEAEVRRCVSTLRLSAVLAEPDTLRNGLSNGLGAIAQTLGIAVEQVEILHARPSDASLLADLAAKHERAVREAASDARLQTNERIKQKELEAARTLSARQEEIARERQVAADGIAMQALRERLGREELELAAKTRTERAALQAVAEKNALEEQKSQPVRDYELQRLATERIAAAFGQMQKARWVSVGTNTPLDSVAGMVTGFKALLTETGAERK